MSLRELPGGPELSILFHCQGHRPSPWLGNEDPASRVVRSPTRPFRTSHKLEDLYLQQRQRQAFRQYKEPHINQQMTDNPMKSVCKTQTGVSEKTGCRYNIINHQGKANYISTFFYQITESLKHTHTWFLVRLWWTCREESILVGQIHTLGSSSPTPGYSQFSLFVDSSICHSRINTCGTFCGYLWQ